MPKKDDDVEVVDDDVESEDEPEKKTNDFPSMFRGLASAVPWKLAIIQFILFFIIMSSQFAEHVISYMNKNWVDGDMLTTSGTVAAGVLLTMGLILFDLLIKGGLI